MANIIKFTDFVGKYQISQNDENEDEVESFINKFYPVYVRRILGATLGNAFIANLDPSGVPTNPIYLELYNPFQVDDNNCVRESIGMKEIILGFVYYEIVRDSNSYNGLSGNKATLGENSEFVDMKNKLSTVYNDSLLSADQVQWYITDYNPNDNDYSDYNGQELDPLLNF
jgi:hypothetical protein